MMAIGREGGGILPQRRRPARGRRFPETRPDPILPVVQETYKEALKQPGTAPRTDELSKEIGRQLRLTSTPVQKFDDVFSCGMVK